MRSSFSKDVEFLLQHDNGDWSEHVSLADLDILKIPHFCYDPQTELPCCGSDLEAKNKMAAAWEKVYCGHAYDVTTESRFTYFRTTGSRVAFGLQHRRLLPALLENAGANSSVGNAREEDVDASIAGAGEADLAKIHGKRVVGTREHLARAYVASMKSRASQVNF